jgi:hypothetical protein
MDVVGDATDRERRAAQLAALICHGSIQWPFNAFRDPWCPTEGSPDQVHIHVCIRRAHPRARIARIQSAQRTSYVEPGVLTPGGRRAGSYPQRWRRRLPYGDGSGRFGAALPDRRPKFAGKNEPTAPTATAAKEPHPNGLGAALLERQQYRNVTSKQRIERCPSTVRMRCNPSYGLDGHPVDRTPARG